MAASSRKDLRVEVPSGDGDKPSWGRVGALAVIGFVIGVAWPKLAGVKIGPAAPAETAAALSADLPAAPPAAQVTSSAPAVSSAAPLPPPISVTVAKGIVLSCKTEDGDSLKGKDCGVVPSFDGVAHPRLKKLSGLASLKDAKGKISVTFFLDFKSKKVGVDVGKSTTIKDDGAIKSFLKEQFQDVSLGPIAHDNEKYTMSYAVTVGEGAPQTTSAPATTGDTEVVWDVAIVRDAPHTGSIVARLPRGTKVHLGASQGGWYKITYGSGSEGWVYRGAVGK